MMVADFRTRIGSKLVESLGNIPGLQMIQDIRERRKLEKEVQERAFRESARLINKTTKEAANLARILSANEDAVRSAVTAAGQNSDEFLGAILEVQKDSMINAGDLNQEQRIAVVNRLESLSGLMSDLPKDMALQMDVGDTFDKFSEIFSRQDASTKSQTEVLDDVNEMLKFMGRSGLDYGDLATATQEEVEELRRTIDGFRKEFKGKKLNLTLDQMTKEFDVLTVSSEEIRDRLGRKNSIGKSVSDTFKERVDTTDMKESMLTGIGTMALGPWFGIAKELGSMANIGSFTELFKGDKDAEKAVKAQVQEQKKQEAETGFKDVQKAVAKSVTGGVPVTAASSPVQATTLMQGEIVSPVVEPAIPVVSPERVQDTMGSNAMEIQSLLTALVDKQEYANELSTEGVFEYQKMVLGLIEIEEQLEFMNEHLWDLQKGGGTAFGGKTGGKDGSESSGFVSSMMGTISGFVSAKIMAPLGAFATSILAKSGLTAVGSTIAGAFSAGVGGITAGIGTALSAGATAVGGAIATGASVLGTVATTIGGAIATGASAFATTIAGAATGAVSLIGTAVTGIGTAVSGLAAGAVSFASTIGTAIMGSVSAIGPALIAAGPAIAVVIAGAVGGAVGTAINDYLLSKGQKEAIGGAITGDMESEEETKALEAKKETERRGRGVKKQKLEQKLSPGIKGDKFLYSKIMNVPGKLREYVSRGVIIEQGGKYFKASELNGEGSTKLESHGQEPETNGEVPASPVPVDMLDIKSMVPTGNQSQIFSQSGIQSVVPLDKEQAHGLRVENMANKENEVGSVSTIMERMLQMQVQQQQQQAPSGASFRRSAPSGGTNSVAPMQVDDLGLILLNAGAF